MKPIIAITAKTEELRNRQQVTLPEAYGKVIEEAGGIPVILPIVDLKPNISEIARFADGFLFSGGDDIHPRHYGEELILDLTLSPDERTEFEIALLHEVLRLKKPVLGVCLGAQLINVALGGNLYQDIPTQIPNALNHRGEHTISIKEGTLLHSIFSKKFMLQKNKKVDENTDLPNRSGFQPDNRQSRELSVEIFIHSAHHQSVKTPGKGLTVSALSTDGVIEAVEMTDYPFLIGVQWHPERSPEDEYTRRLFNAFIDSAKNNNRK